MAGKRRVNRVDAFFGVPGVGKTTVARLAAADLGWKCKVFHFANQAFEDITGLPFTEDGNDGQKVMHFAKHTAIPGVVHENYENDSQGTLGVIDDGHRTPAVQQGQLVEMIDGNLNGDALDPRCIMIFTGNPPDPAIVTGQAIDSALEDRLNVHVVHPTAEELLEVWSLIMPERIFKFLALTPAFVDAVSPRAWDGIAHDVQDMLESGASPDEAINDVRCEFVGNLSVETQLRGFMRHGDNPYYYPILGRSLVLADERQNDEHMKLVKKWLDNEKDALIGETKNDLIRAVSNLPALNLSGDQKQQAAKNIAALLSMLAETRYADMAQDCLKGIWEGELTKMLMHELEGTAGFDRLIQVYSRHTKPAAAAL